MRIGEPEYASQRHTTARQPPASTDSGHHAERVMAAREWSRSARPGAGSFALHHRERLHLQVDVVLAGDVDDCLLDRAAGERVRGVPA